MNNFNKLLIFGLLILGFTACKKQDDINDVMPVNLSVKLIFDADNSSYGFTYEKAQVKITNLTTTQSYTATAAANGTVNFTSIAPGNYDVSTSLSISAADYNSKAGTNVQDAVVYNGTLSSQSVVSNTQLSVTLKTGRIGDFVIKQIYYAGSNPTNGAVFRDQFVEIYNNANETLYADSLYIAQAIGVNTAINSVDFTKSHFLPSGQYNWTKSQNMNDANANTNYIYVKALYMIPGSGRQHPVEPGKSIIIAASAINHQSPYTGTDGRSISVKDPSLTIDLTNADFEVYMGNYPGINPLASDLDNPAVTNLNVIHNVSSRDLIFDNLGRDGVVIFKSKINPATWNKYATPDVPQVIATTDLYIQVPVNILTDGVNLQHAVTASRIAHRFTDVIDAGETFVLGGSYSSQSVVRKTSKIVNGRVILKDTNNSTNDFGNLSKADPSKSASSFIN